jgi:urease accessory protein
MRIEQTMRLLQWGDSTLPVGAFSFSNGLETAVQTGLVKNARDLEDFLLDLLEQTAQIDGVALLVAHRSAEQMTLADEALLARKLNQETRLQTLRMGKKLAEVAARVVGFPDLLEHINSGRTPGCYPVVQARLMARLGHSAQETFAVAQYGLASAVVSAALRLMRVDHFETQRILFASGEHIEQQYQRLREAELEDMASFSPMLDVLAALHVQAHVRLFMN